MDAARLTYTNNFYASWSTASLIEFIAAHNADTDNELQQITIVSGTRDEIRTALDISYVVEGTPPVLVHLGKKTGDLHTSQYHGAAFTDSIHSDGIVSHTATTAGDHPSPATSTLTFNTSNGDFLLHPGGDTVEHLTGRASPTQPHILRVASAWNLGEPISIRDSPANGGPARYLASSTLTLSTETPASGAAPRSFKWASDASPAFQINMETIAGVALETSATPPLTTPQGGNGDRWTSTAASYSGVPTDVEAAIVHPEFPHKVLFIKGDNIYIHNLDTTAHEVTESVATRWPQFTGTLSYAFAVKGTNSAGETIFWRLNLYNTLGTKFRWEYSYPDTGAWTYLDTTPNHRGPDWTAQAEGWNMIFRETGGVSEVEANPNTNIYVAYGAGTSIYTSLPTGIKAAFYDKVNSKSYAIKGSTLYELNTTTKTVVATTPIGADVVTDNHLNAGNFVDGKDYTLKIDTSAATMPVQTYGQATVQEAVDWTCDSVWGHTVWRGTIVEADGKVRFILTTGAGGKGVYRPWPGEPNAQEAYTAHGVGAVTLEVIEYVYTGSLATMPEGAQLVPVLQNSRGGPDANDTWLTRTDGQPWALQSNILNPQKNTTRIYKNFAKNKHFS